MQELHTSPATARTDVRTAPATLPMPTASLVRRCGWGLAAGAATFGISFFFIGPESSVTAARIGDLAGLAFQIGLFGLLLTMLRTGATGVSRLARAMIRVEFGLLTLASIWSVLHALLPGDLRDAGWLAVLDLFWPLSMLGMFVIGIKVAVAGRWTGLTRCWPLVAESWAVVTLPAVGILGYSVGSIVGGAHLLIGYTFLGILLAVRPQQTGAV